MSWIFCIISLTPAGELSIWWTASKTLAGRALVEGWWIVTGKMIGGIELPKVIPEWTKWTSTLYEHLIRCPLDVGVTICSSSLSPAECPCFFSYLFYQFLYLELPILLAKFNGNDMLNISASPASTLWEWIFATVSYFLYFAPLPLWASIERLSFRLTYLSFSQHFELLMLHYTLILSLNE